jgi:hypothetical protein
MNIFPVMARRKQIISLLVDGQEARMVWGSHCRQVFKFNGYYIKFDNPCEHETGYYGTGIQSRLELEFLENILPEHKKFFNIPVAYGKTKGLYYTVQKELLSVNRYTTHRDTINLEMLTNLYSLSDVSLPDCNCVLTPDSFVIYDYAPINVGTKRKRGLHTIKKSLKPQIFSFPENNQLNLF